ncbi:ATP-binding protein [Streptomyces sp. NPDC046465]|uniref:ATP-binding protein n=1 Tax=Streptomyces sp. NPDC046465 TaxID=3155810 RepID=UPI0033CE43A6
MTTVISPDTAPLTWPRSPGAARDLVRALLRQGTQHVGDMALADAVLVTSELVTNAIRHGGGLRGFACRLRPGVVEIAVDDSNDAVPVTRPRTSLLVSGGLGWPAVCRLADEVSVTHLPCGGKRIVAHVPLAA